MYLSTHYRVYPTDTRNVRALLKSEGLKVKQARLGSNHWYILVNTNDNRKARRILESNGYELNYNFETEHDHIFQRDHMMMHKIVS